MQKMMLTGELAQLGRDFAAASGAAAVTLIPDDRKSSTQKMDANLMTSSSDGFAFDQRQLQGLVDGHNVKIGL